MDIIIKSILDYVQSIEGHKNSILAGGAPRDILLGLIPKDYDICLPSNSPKQIHDLARSVVQEFNITDMVLKTQDYENQTAGKNPWGKLLASAGISKRVTMEAHIHKLTCVYGFSFEGKKIDLIGHKEDDDEDFANEVIQGFDYGINMVYDTGSYVYDENSFFSEDLSYRTMTLVNLPSMEELPKAMERYNRLSNRYKEAYGQGLRFRSTCLELNKPKSKVEIDPYSYKKLYGHSTLYLDEASSIGPEPQWATTTEQAVIGNFPSAVNVTWDQPEQAVPTMGPMAMSIQFGQGDAPVLTVNTDEFDDNF